jgi:serine/threonine-protein kinase HipA
MIAEVWLWGRRIAAVMPLEQSRFTSFQYDPEFAGSGIEVSPLMMPLREEAYEFPGLSFETFKGLPGLVADSLPDKFGNALIDAWLARQGRQPGSASVIERLCYMGSRGMGALEFRPASGPAGGKDAEIDISQMVELAGRILGERSQLETSITPETIDHALLDILKIGTSAGGARAKAVISWNPKTNVVKSGQIATESDFEYWLIKFDGVNSNRDKELDDSAGFGAIEYAYSLMAKQAGITMAETRLLEEGGRRHFMTKRFDRLAGGKKLHMQSLGGLAHFDFNQARAHSYEQALDAIRQLNIGQSAMEEQFRRAAFNVIARNQDDHVKNIAFLMDQKGKWQLSPAYDVAYSFNPSGAWTSTHQMTINGKADNFKLDDLIALAKIGNLTRQKAKGIIEEVRAATKEWPKIAEEVGIPEREAAVIQKNHRLEP